jgi:hypothetical protein
LEGGEDSLGKEKPAMPTIAHTIKRTTANTFSAVLNIIYDLHIDGVSRGRILKMMA